MKKTLFMLLGAALMVVAGCKKDDNKLNNGEKMTFTSDLSGGAKTEISGKLMKWTEGDEIVINGKTFTSEISQEGAFATFTGDAVEPTYHAYYPASLYDNGNYVLPATQTYSGTNLSLVNPMYARSENTTLQFRNICALVKLDLTGTDKVKTIVAQAGKPLSGTFTVKEENGKFYAELSSKDGAATVTLNCGDEGIQLNTTTPTTFYIALPQGEYTDLTFTLSDGTQSTVVDAANAMLEAGHIWNKTAKVSYFHAPVDVLPGLFSVSANKQVYFSKGNLWADGINALHFEDAQWKSTPTSGGNMDAGHVSHFTWSNTVAAAVGEYDSGGNLFCDESHKVSVDGSDAIYYALSKDEWIYLFGNHSYKWVSVNGVNGYVIAPDGFSGNLADSYTDAALAANNLVFLPAAGYRMYSNVINVGSHGTYWSSSYFVDYFEFEFEYEEIWNLFNVYFYDGCVTPDSFGTNDIGHSVRLVTNAK